MRCNGNWTRVSQRFVRYLPQTQGLLLIHNPSAEWTEATVHEWLAQDHDANCHSRESNPSGKNVGKQSMHREDISKQSMHQEGCMETIYAPGIMSINNL